jgi:hypothetical protein
MMVAERDLPIALQGGVCQLHCDLIRICVVSEAMRRQVARLKVGGRGCLGV